MCQGISVYRILVNSQEGFYLMWLCTLASLLRQLCQSDLLLGGLLNTFKVIWKSAHVLVAFL